MEKILKTLQNLGIGEKQACVYLAGLELGRATIQELADKSKIKRTSIYNFLEEIKDLGLMTEVKEGNKTVLIAENPQVVIEQARRRVARAENALPELMGIFNRPARKPKVKFFQGVSGLKQAYDDILHSKGNTVYAFTDYDKMFEILDEQYMYDWASQRAKKGKRFLGIAKFGKHYSAVNSKNKDHLREMKHIDKVNFETEINIYGDKVNLISFKKPGAAVIIEDQAIAQTLKSVWELVWNSLK